MGTINSAANTAERGSAPSQHEAERRTDMQSDSTASFLPELGWSRQFDGEQEALSFIALRLWFFIY
jgi:hypothetical protein